MFIQFCWMSFLKFPEISGTPFVLQKRSATLPAVGKGNDWTSAVGCLELGEKIVVTLGWYPP